MRILIIGAGAIGGMTAAYMKLAGLDISLLCRRAATAELIRSQGLRLSGVRGQQRVILPAFSSAEELEGLFDYIIVATKTYSAAQAARSVLPHLAADGLVLFLQNGISIPEQQEAVGEWRMACGVVSWSCTALADAQLELTGEGGFIIGRTDGADDTRLSGLKSALEAMAPTRISADIFADMYAKLIINSGVTCGGALTGQRLGRMLLSRRARRFFISLVREDMALAAALQLTVPPFGGKLDYYRFLAGETCFDELRRQLTLLAIGLRYWRLKSSSLTTLEQGGLTEVEALNGWISAQAALHGVATPVNNALVRLIKEIEQGQRPISPDNLKEIV